MNFTRPQLMALPRTPQEGTEQYVPVLSLEKAIEIVSSRQMRDEPLPKVFLVSLQTHCAMRASHRSAQAISYELGTLTILGVPVVMNPFM